MKKLLLVLLVAIATIGYSQTPEDKLSPNLRFTLAQTLKEDATVHVWIIFKDKGTETAKYFAAPSLVVSEKSLERRAKVFPKGQLIDNSDLPVNRNYIEQVESLGIKIKGVSRWFNAVSALVKPSQVASLARLSSVREMDLCYGLKKKYDHSTAAPVFVDPVKEIHTLDYGISATQNNQINVPALHDLGFHGEGVIVAMLDAGFNNLAHQAFANMTILAKYDFVNNDPDVGDGTDMGEGSHGTETLSTIGGYKPGSLIGPAFGAHFVLAKTENTDSETPIEEDNWIRGAEWADSLGADVISCSLGYITFDSPYTSYTWQNMDGNTCRITIAADLTVKKGIVCVNSAGNEGDNTSHNTLGAPADGDSVITAGAVTSSGTRSSFSSVGPTVDGRTKPDIVAMGSSVYVASPTSTTGYTYSDGTSFSCPLSAGVAALILSVNHNLTPMEVREAMRSTASKASAPDNKLGWGILNALQAGQLVMSRDNVPPTKITSLTATDVASKKVTLQFAAPQDSSTGGVKKYDIRYSTSAINDTVAFLAATPFVYSGTPKTPGQLESVTITGLNVATSYYFAVRSADVWNNWSLVSNTVNKTTLAAPALTVTPDSVVRMVLHSSEVTDTVFISNTSANPSTLDYSTTLVANNFDRSLVSLSVTPIADQATKSTTSKDVVNELPIGQSGLGSGGPDAFGYKWKDSDDPTGPAYVWNDIVATGTQVTTWTATGTGTALDDGISSAIPIGFPFKFYGTDKTNVYVTTNGLVVFTTFSGNNGYSNTTIPTAAIPGDFIAPFWDDLDGRTQGTVHYKAEPGKLTIQFTNWQKYSATSSLNFQVVLNSSGKILIYYKDMTATLTSATVGIENAAGTDGLQIAYNAAYIHNNMAVAISNQLDWVEATMVAGTLSKGQKAGIGIKLKSLDLANGVYSMTLKVSSSDPLKPTVNVPIVMKVVDILPVELSNFNAVSNENGVALSWNTITEKNNKGFYVERKESNSGNWNALTFIEGKGTSTIVNSYSYTDKNSKSGVNTSYRLRQVDFDGSVNYSNIVNVTPDLPSDFKVYQNYPNPFNPETNIKFAVPTAGLVLAKVFNAQGEEVKTLVNEVKQAGNYEVRLNGENLASGVYFVRFNFNNSSKVIKVNLLK